MASRTAVIGSAKVRDATVTMSARMIASVMGNVIVIFGTGGLSHQLQGERAGIIDVDYDLDCIRSVIDNPDWLADQTTAEIIEKAGTEGVEVIMWLVMRGALHPDVNVIHKHYHVPISNTGAGVLVLENAA